MTGKKILVAEDDPTNIMVLKHVLTHGGYEVEAVENGLEALEILKRTPFDILLTDLQLPGMDGMELARYAINHVRPAPLVIMITACDTPELQKRALAIGIHEYLTKPLNYKKLHKSFKRGLAKTGEDTPEFETPALGAGIKKPPFVGIVIASSTGGPQALEETCSGLSLTQDASVFITQHGPDWMLRLLAEQLERQTHLSIQVAEDNMAPEPGRVYLAPGDKHLSIDSTLLNLKLLNLPKINFVKPSADPLFRSAAEAFGAFCIAVVLSGLGRDGARGVEAVAANGGVVLIQDPKTAVAPFMPNAAIATGVKNQVVPLSEMKDAIQTATRYLTLKLNKDIPPKN